MKSQILRALSLSGALLLTPICTPLAQAQNAAATAPRPAYIVAAQGQDVTLDIGQAEGAQTGAIYGIARGGKTGARVQVFQVRVAESIARVLEAEDGFTVTVGDEARFIAVRPLPPELQTLPTAPVEPAPLTPILPQPSGELGTTPSAVTPDATPLSPSMPPSTTPSMPSAGAAMSGGLASVTSASGNVVTLAGGTSNGLRSGSSLPILRNGSVVAVVRLSVVSNNEATGSVVWRDEANGPILVGDQVVVPTPSAPPTGVLPVEDAPDTTTPVTPVRFETGGSNAVVPHADRSYELLATLAAQGLITRYPAHLFHDDGARFHRTEEDITFTRSQIAGLIREALLSDKAPEASQKVRVALGLLISEYGPDLSATGVEAETLNVAARQKGFEFGIGGQQRISVTRLGGDASDDVAIDPFSERQGGRRSRSGLDTRTELFARAGDKLQFFGQLDGGSDVRRGFNDDAFKLRRGVFSYDAGNLLRGLKIEGGRDEFWWGPGHFGTLLLGDNAGPLNHLRAVLKRGSYTFEGLYAPIGDSRALYGHNLQFQIGKQVRAGFAETVLAPTKEFTPALFAATFSPFPLFAADRLFVGTDGDDAGNVQVAGYAEASVARGAQVYGELLIDDIGTNNNNLVRNRLGTLIGAHFFSPSDPAKIGLYAEFTNLQGATYLGLNEPDDYDYYFRNRPLGYPVAPTRGDGRGAESLRVDGYFRLGQKLRLGAGVEFADLNSEGPVLARQQTLRFRAAYDLSRKFTIVARAQRVSTSRPGFVVGTEAQQQLFQLELVNAF